MMNQCGPVGYSIGGYNNCRQLSNQQQNHQRPKTRNDYFGKFRFLKFDLKWPELKMPDMLKDFSVDHICYSGEVIDEAASTTKSHLRKTAESARELPKQGKQFADSQAEILHSHSKVLKTQLSENWNSSIASIASMPSAISESWDYHANIYHEQQKQLKQQQ